MIPRIGIRPGRPMVVLHPMFTLTSPGAGLKRRGADMYFRKAEDAVSAVPKSPNQVSYVENTSRVNLTLSPRFSFLSKWSRQISKAVSVANTVVGAERQLPRLVERTLSRRMFELRFLDRRFLEQRTGAPGRDGATGRGEAGRDGRSVTRLGFEHPAASPVLPRRRSLDPVAGRRGSVMATPGPRMPTALGAVHPAETRSASRGSASERRTFAKGQGPVSGVPSPGFVRLELVDRHFRAMEMRVGRAEPFSTAARPNSQAEHFAGRRGRMIRGSAAAVPIARPSSQMPAALAFRKSSNRSALAPGVAPPAVSPPTAKPAVVDIARLDAELWKRFEKRIRIEQERRGR